MEFAVSVSEWHAKLRSMLPPFPSSLPFMWYSNLYCAVTVPFPRGFVNCVMNGLSFNVDNMEWDSVSADGLPPRYEHATFITHSPDGHGSISLYMFGGAKPDGSVNDVWKLNLGMWESWMMGEGGRERRGRGRGRKEGREGRREKRGGERERKVTSKKAVDSPPPLLPVSHFIISYTYTRHK